MKKYKNENADIVFCFKTQIQYFRFLYNKKNAANIFFKI